MSAFADLCFDDYADELEPNLAFVDFHDDRSSDDEPDAEQWAAILAEQPLVFDDDERDRLWTVH